MTELFTASLPPGHINLHYCVLFNESINDTDLDADRDRCFIPILVLSSISLFICLVGLVGNGIVLWVLGFCLKKNPFTVYVLNLAIADFGFLLCMVAFLVAIVVYIHMDFHGGFVIINAIQWVALFTYNTGLYLLTAISVQRCLSVLFPFWHRCHRPENLSSAVCTLLWVLSILVTSLECYFCITDYECSKMTIFSCVLSFLVFTPLMILSSLTLFIKIRCSSQQHQPTKLYVVIMVTILFFLVFALPFQVIVMMAFLRETTIHLFVMSLVILLPCLNSSINPFIYVFIGRHGRQQIREPLREVFQRIFKEEAESQEKRPTIHIK
ncbi:mas-related G-protein coupled receptor member H-like [Carettochelys insculpta]|uniref:mas-related G-protein coupled receptor member H-like n=1 Tax=Carettochelys insculpta TaxID=44489 RepID=UPI003EBD2603